MTEEGFGVESRDLSGFLEDKLEILGLSEREAEEMIIYWLPQMQEYPYLYIRFAEADEIRSNMDLIIEPCPDTLIRICMVWKPLETYNSEIREAAFSYGT